MNASWAALGLQAIQGASLNGAKRIIAVDINPDKFEVGTSIERDSYCFSKCATGRLTHAPAAQRASLALPIA